MAEFMDGISVKQPHEKAPDFVIADVAIQTEKFITWLRDNTNDRGYVNGTIKRSQKGTLYIEKSTYQSQSQQQRTQQSARYTVVEQEDDQQLPF